MRRKKLLLLLLCVTLALSGVVRAESARGKVVRVGWYESAYHRTDPFGRRSGYGYEYQQRIATYTGWTYEYVEGSWSELYELLVAGELDLLSDVSYTPERAEKILYSAEGMGAEDYHAFIRPDNTEITPDDFSTFNGKRVGVNKNSIQEQMFKEWADNHKVYPTIVELSGKTPELLDMLAKGEIDVLVTLDTYGNSADVLPVCKVGSATSFFGVNRARPDIKQELDVAMNRIFEENRNFNQQLSEQFTDSGALNSFVTADEKRWLTQHGTIVVGYHDNFLPFCSTDADGALTGALKDYLAFAENCERNARLSFETRAYKDMEDALAALERGEVDCVFPVNLSTYDGEQRGMVVTDPYVRTEMNMAVLPSDHTVISPELTLTAAVKKGHVNHETFLKDNFPNWRILYCDTYEDCYRAVADGRADCTPVSNYRISRMGNIIARFKLTTLTTGQTARLSFALNRSNDCLYSILNKVNHLIPDSAANSTLTNYALESERVTFLDYLRDNLAAVVAAAAMTISLILFLVLLNVKSQMKSSERRQIISETERDHLTNLYNRNFFVAYTTRLAQEQPDTPMDAIVLNIDRFHSYNTMEGREFGDELLRTLGREIAAFLAETKGYGGRMEGDHFDIYCAHREDYPALLERFQQRLTDDFPSADVRVRMGVMPWQAGLSPLQMFDRAWSACSMVRGDFKTHLMVYDEELRRRAAYNQRLLSDLPRALEQRELEVFYQPKFDIRVDPPVLSSAEALIRWRHPELGMIPPGDFIPLFERSGQITALDKYVWAEAARQVAEWRTRYGHTLPVSVNLSRVDVFDPDLFDTLDSIIEANGLDRRDLKLEVTESVYTENAEHMIEIITELRARGYEIEMDDFGSGYSSLNMLSSMPIDVLKMDMAFVRNIERNQRDLRLVELILDIARYLHVPVIAEGVETEAQLSLLKGAGCDIVQGYYFSRPLIAEEFERKMLQTEA